ncbi:MAG: ExbD/TolR family protein [Myxococcota bacterium]
MAGTIDVGGSGRGRKQVDVDVPLVPFIDLLLCCLMFLLVTAMWNELAMLESHGVPPDASDVTAPAPDATNEVRLHVGRDAYRIGTTAGDRVRLANVAGRRDVQALATRLRAMRSWSAIVVVTADDGVEYRDVIQTVDVATGVGFEHVRVTDAKRG